MTVVSHSHEFIFIHNIKVAGNSVRDALKECAETSYFSSIILSLWRWIDINQLNETHFFPDRWKVFPKHLKARDLKRMLSPRVYDNFFKFIFVRNPWDWQVSLYHYILEHPLHPQHEMFKSMKDFEEYIQWRVNHNKVRCQKDCVTDEDGNLIVDFVGKYEELAEDFQHVCMLLGVEARLPHLNRSAHRNYKTYYSDKMIEITTAGFQEDIEFFGYTFDNTR